MFNDSIVICCLKKTCFQINKPPVFYKSTRKTDKVGERGEKMKRNIFIGFLSFVFLILSACSDQAMEVEDVVEEIKEHRDEVENYNSLTEFNVEVDAGDDLLNDSSYMKMDVDIDEAANAIHAHILEGNDGEEYTQELYSGEDSIGYQTEGDSEWFKFDVGDVPVTEGFTSAYDKITALIENIEDELEVEEEDDHYLLTFEGASEDVLSALEEPFNVEVNGVEDEDIIHELIITVTKDNFHITQLTDIIAGEAADGSGTITIDIDQKYSDINDLDDIVVPEDIVNSATEL